MRTTAAVANAAKKLCAASVILAALALVPSCVLATAPSNALTLWYDQPAADWEREGLPTGNGTMGAMLMGGIAVDDIQFNEKSLSTGGPGSTEGYDFGLPQTTMADGVAKVRTMLEKSKRLPPEDVANIRTHKGAGFGAYQSFGDLILTLTNPPKDTQDYRRPLDIAHAVASLTYKSGGVRYAREYFVSDPDGVIVIRLSADHRGKIGFKAASAINI